MSSAAELRGMKAIKRSVAVELRSTKAHRPQATCYGNQGLYLHGKQ